MPNSSVNLVAHWEPLGQQVQERLLSHSSGVVEVTREERLWHRGLTATERGRRRMGEGVGCGNPGYCGDSGYKIHQVKQGSEHWERGTGFWGMELWE